MPYASRPDKSRPVLHIGGGGKRFLILIPLLTVVACQQAAVKTPSLAASKLPPGPTRCTNALQASPCAPNLPENEVKASLALVDAGGRFGVQYLIRNEQNAQITLYRTDGLTPAQALYENPVRQEAYRLYFDAQGALSRVQDERSGEFFMLRYPAPERLDVLKYRADGSYLSGFTVVYQGGSYRSGTLQEASALQNQLQLTANTTGGSASFTVQPALSTGLGSLTPVPPSLTDLATSIVDQAALGDGGLALKRALVTVAGGVTALNRSAGAENAALASASVVNVVMASEKTLSSGGLPERANLRQILGVFAQNLTCGQSSILR